MWVLWSGLGADLQRPNIGEAGSHFRHVGASLLDVPFQHRLVAENAIHRGGSFVDVGRSLDRNKVFINELGDNALDRLLRKSRFSAEIVVPGLNNSK